VTQQHAVCPGHCKLRVAGRSASGRSLTALRSRLLVRHPRVLERLRWDIASVMEDTVDLSRERLRKMIFLNCVVKESKL
jgi:hypothetical protein